VAEEGARNTYESPPGGADTAGLEDYVVETMTGERIGTVVVSVEESGRRWLVVETGTPPVKRDRRAVPWSEIEEVDHDALTVVVTASSAASLERIPDTGREGQGAAERVTDTPDSPGLVPTGDVAGPIDRTSTLFAALACFALGLLTLLGVVAILSRHGKDWPYVALVVVPVALILLSGGLGYRLWRDPYSR
jgi:hypothetical protein